MLHPNHGPRRRRLALLAVPVMLALAACVPPPTAPVGKAPAAAQGVTVSQPVQVSAPAVVQAPQELRLMVKEWGFTPNALTLPQGKPVTLILDNQGNIEHDVTIPALGVHLAAAASGTAKQTVTAQQAGTFD